MDGNRTPAAESQVQPITSANKKYRRRLDHMADLADGIDQFDMIPRKLSRAYLDGNFPEPKFRLLLCMMSHSGTFQIKRSYLDERFHDSTLAKYLPELEAEGYIEVEYLRGKPGKPAKLYHVRSLEHWKLYRQNANPSPTGDLNTPPTGDLNPSPTGVLKKSNPKENKNQDNNDDDGIQEIPIQKDASSSLDKRAVDFASKFDWLYKRSPNGGYSYSAANNAAKNFLRNLNADYLNRFEQWLWQQKQWDGMLKVTADMFQFLESRFDESEAANPLEKNR